MKPVQYQLVTADKASGSMTQHYVGSEKQCRNRYYAILEAIVMPSYPGLQWLDMGRYLSIIETKDIEHERVAIYMMATI